MEKISWNDGVTNEEVSQKFKEERIILHAINNRKPNWFGHVLCRNCLLNTLLKER